jgi:hypothetical protein
VTQEELLDQLMQRQRLGQAPTETPFQQPFTERGTSTPKKPSRQRLSRQSISLDSPTLIGIAGIAFIGGFLLWFVGARFTIDGIVWTINMLLSFLTIEYQIEVSTNIYLYLIIFPVIFSLVEIRGTRHRIMRLEGSLRWLSAGVVLFIHAADIATTFIGLPPTVHWIGRTAMMVALTYLPEAGMVGGWQLAKMAFKK